MNRQEDTKLYIPSNVCVNILLMTNGFNIPSLPRSVMCSLYRTYVNVDFVRCDNDCNICICVYMCTYIMYLHIYIYMTMYFVKKALNDCV